MPPATVNSGAVNDHADRPGGQRIDRCRGSISIDASTAMSAGQATTASPCQSDQRRADRSARCCATPPAPFRPAADQALDVIGLAEGPRGTNHHGQFAPGHRHGSCAVAGRATSARRPGAVLAPWPGSWRCLRSCLPGRDHLPPAQLHEDVARGHAEALSSALGVQQEGRINPGEAQRQRVLDRCAPSDGPSSARSRPRPHPSA